MIDLCIHGAIVLHEIIRDKDKDPSFSAKQARSVNARVFGPKSSNVRAGRTKRNEPLRRFDDPGRGIKGSLFRLFPESQNSHFADFRRRNRKFQVRGGGHRTRVNAWEADAA